MFKEILQDIEGFGFWAIISMLVFLLFFIIIMFKVIKSDKNQNNYMSELPLE